MKMQSFERFMITAGGTGATFSLMWDKLYNSFEIKRQRQFKNNYILKQENCKNKNNVKVTTKIRTL